jgi:hypothetical protein
MSRVTGWVLAVVLVVVVGREACAQVPGSSPAYGGGFGLDYAQPIPSNSFVLDRWGMLEATPMLGVALPAPGMVERPATARPAQVGRVARRTRAVRSLSRVNTRRTSRRDPPLLARPAVCVLRIRLWRQSLRHRRLRRGLQGAVFG